MKVPFVDLRAQYHAIQDEIDAAIRQVINDTAFVGGKYLSTFEKNFSAFVGGKFCVGVGNGTDALFVALKALGIGPEDEVITAANTFIATAEAITMTGAKVVFVDCDPQTYNLDTHKIEAAITPRTKAIIPVHLYGQPVDMDVIGDLARKYHLQVVEDAAQAHAASYRGQSIGSISGVTCFSFFPGKNLGAYGDAGAIVVNDEELATRVRMVANHGRVKKYDHEFEGINSRLDGLQAAILDAKLGHLEEWTERRRAIAAKYDAHLGQAVVTPFAAPDVRHVYHLYVIRVKNRDRVRSQLDEKGIATGIHYPIALPFLQAYRYLNHKPEDFPVAHAFQDEILSLPIHGSMPEEQVDYVIEQLLQAVPAA
jgi:dTDP-4-amino-4,6-dideoxygalactose transaminase